VCINVAHLRVVAVSLGVGTGACWRASAICVEVIQMFVLAMLLLLLLYTCVFLLGREWVLLSIWVLLTEFAGSRVASGIAAFGAIDTAAAVRRVGAAVCAAYLQDPLSAYGRAATYMSVVPKTTTSISTPAASPTPTLTSALTTATHQHVHQH